MSSIPALTVWQPWASLIIEGAKPYEFRGWAAPRAYRGRRIAIHAGARPVKVAEVRALIVRLRSGNAWSTCLHPEPALAILDRLRADPTLLPLGHVLGTAVLGEPVLGMKVTAEFGGPVNDSDRDEHANWAWPLTSIEPLRPPVPARGAQGLWSWMDGAAC